MQQQPVSKSRQETLTLLHEGDERGLGMDPASQTHSTVVCKDERKTEMEAAPNAVGNMRHDGKVKNALNWFRQLATQKWKNVRQFCCGLNLGEGLHTSATPQTWQQARGWLCGLKGTQADIKAWSHYEVIHGRCSHCSQVPTANSNSSYTAQHTINLYHRTSDHAHISHTPTHISIPSDIDTQIIYMHL